MNKLNSPFKVNLLTGFLLGQVLFGWYHVKLLAAQYGMYEKAIDIMMLIIIIMTQYWAIKYIKERFCDNFITYRKSFSYGILISVFSFLFILIDFIILFGIKYSQSIELDPQLLGKLLFLSLSVLLYGLFLNIFVSLFLKSEPKNYQEIEEDTTDDSEENSEVKE